MMKKILSIVYVAILIVLDVATFLENEHGVNWAHSHIYGSWWFALLWAILAVLSVAYFIKRRVRKPSVVLLHVALVIILLGALVSHINGRSGSIHLRLFHPQDIVSITHNGEDYLHRLPYEVTLQNFEVISDEDGNDIDFRSDFTIDGADASVSMNRIYRHGNLRFYQMSYDDDLCGSTLIVNRDPYGIPITYCGYFLLFGSLIALCVKNSASMWLWLLSVGLTLLWCMYYFVLDGSWAHIPVLRSPLLFVHVVTIIMAYALLLIQAVASLIWLVSKQGTKTGGLNSNSIALLRLSLLFLCIGIFLGAIWANISWGNYWSWDSKEVWALITLLVYAVPAHRLSFSRFNNPSFYHKYMLIAFATVIMTYFGVNYCLAGMHSYV